MPVELAGEDMGQQSTDNRQRKPKKRDEMGHFHDGFEPFEKKNKKRDSSEGRTKPSREERGYTNKRGPMKKDDWKQFFQHDDAFYRCLFLDSDWRPQRYPYPVAAKLLRD